MAVKPWNKMSTWEEILNSILRTLTPVKAQKSDTTGIENLAGKLGQNSKYMTKARQSLGDVTGMISKDTLTRIARTIKDSEKATKFRTTNPDELTGIANNVVKGKTVKVLTPTSDRYIDSHGKSPYTKGSYDIDRSETMDKEVKIQSTAVEKATYDPKTQIAAVKFTSGDKWYNYVMTPDEWEAFMKSPSKGRHVHYVMTPRNWLPGYHRKKRR